MLVYSIRAPVDRSGLDARSDKQQLMCARFHPRKVPKKPLLLNIVALISFSNVTFPLQRLFVNPNFLNPLRTATPLTGTMTISENKMPIRRCFIRVFTVS